jgi:hypothetical protein
VITQTTAVHALTPEMGVGGRAAVPLTRNCSKWSMKECFITVFFQIVVNFKMRDNSDDKTIYWLKS